jgi:hypothetical protein
MPRPSSPLPAPPPPLPPPSPSRSSSSPPRFSNERCCNSFCLLNGRVVRIIARNLFVIPSKFLHFFKLSLALQIQNEGHYLQFGAKDALLNALLMAAKRFRSGPPQVRLTHFLEGLGYGFVLFV